MATSGTTTFSVSVQTVVEDALQNIGVLGIGSTLKAEDSELAIRKLNMLVKQWVGQADFAPGLKMWTRKRAYLTLVAATSAYEVPGDAALDEDGVTDMRRPFEIVSASLRDTDGKDQPIDHTMTVQEYEQIGEKSATGTPARFYFEPRRTTSRIFLDCVPDDVTKTIRLVYLSYIEDLTDLSEDVDLPAEWFRPASAQLSIDLCSAYGKPVSPELKMMRDESLAIARNAYPEKSTAGFYSEPDDY